MSLVATLKKTVSKVARYANNNVPSESSFDTLNNKWILYFILFVSVVNLFNFFNNGDTTAIAIFVIAGFLTSYFSKNMLVILVISIAITHIVRYGKASVEGMEGEDEEEGMEGEEEEEGIEDEEEEEGMESKEHGDKKRETLGLNKITESLEQIKKLHPDEIAGQTQTLIEQTKKVQENMAMLEPYLKQASDATKPLKAEGFCDYEYAYKK
jgi:hypothetical protein